MATKTESTTPEFNPASFVMDTKKVLAEQWGLAILGKGDYFNAENASEMSAELRELQLYTAAIVSAHDNLADDTGNERLVGKRGRKSGEAAKPTTVDDVMRKLARK